MKTRVDKKRPEDAATSARPNNKQLISINTATDGSCQGGSMYSDKIVNAACALNFIKSDLSVEDAALLRSVRAELMDAAENVKNLEELPISSDELMLISVMKMVSEEIQEQKNG